MAGKTGTSQVRRITKAERQAGVRKAEQVPWKERDHALFVAFAPVDAPRYASPWWSSMAAAAPRSPRRSRATSCCEAQRRDPSRSTPARLADIQADGSVGARARPAPRAAAADSR